MTSEVTKLTLAFLRTDTELLLGMKKRGFGSDRYNGFGGKIEPGETVTAAAVRELSEECGVSVLEGDLVPMGNILFHIDGRHLHIHVFMAHAWNGEPCESDEMCPEWFSLTDIPYQRMWVDDQHWLPQVLAGKAVEGEVWFGEREDEIVDMKWQFS